jgi:hypothetical protein
MISFYFLIRAGGGNVFAFLLQSWRRGYLSDTALSGASSPYSSLFVPGMFLLPLAGIVWLAILGSKGQSPGMGFWVYALTVQVALFLVMPRATQLGSLLSLMFVYHYAVRRLSVRHVAGFGLIGWIYAYAMGVWRGVSHSASGIDQFGPLLWENASMRGLSEFILSGSLSDIRIFVLVAHHYGRDVPLAFGSTLLRILTQFIPHALWPAKPIDLGVELGRLSNPLTISGTPAGFVAEMYMNFHAVGVLVGAAVLGALVRRLYRHLMLSDELHLTSIVIYAVTVPSLLLLPSRTISLAAVSWLIPVGAAFLALWLCRAGDASRRSRPPTSSHQG